MWLRRVLLAVSRSPSRSDYEGELKRHGLQVMSADNGVECLGILREFTPDIVVIEPELLWGGGDGVLAVLSEMPGMWIVPIVVLTADSSPKLDCLSLFATTELLKRPVSAERLVGRVARLAFGDQWPFITGARRHNAPGILAGLIAITSGTRCGAT